MVNGKNFYVKLQLLCDPLGYYAHIYFYLPINIDSEGHVLFPRPEFMGMQYPKLEFDALDRFETDSITVPVADSTEAPLVGNDAGEHGCVASAGYEWCEEEDKCYRAWEESCGAAIGGEADDYGCIAAAGYEWCEEESKCYRAWEEECGAPIGGEADEHNCYGSAGYVWCESNAKCYRVWEEDCPSATSSGMFFVVLCARIYIKKCVFIFQWRLTAEMKWMDLLLLDIMQSSKELALWRYLLFLVLELLYFV